MNFINIDKILDLYIDFQKNDYYTYKQCEKLYNRLSARKVRLRQKLEFMFSKFENPIFLSMTFRDEYLNTTTKEQRHLAIIRFLKNSFNMYVANIDFGKINGREHYHAICDIPLSDENRQFYFNNYGSINFIYIYSKDSKKLSRYLDKLINHSFKDTTANKCIYSRNRIK